MTFVKLLGGGATWLPIAAASHVIAQPEVRAVGPVLHQWIRMQDPIWAFSIPTLKLMPTDAFMVKMEVE